MNMGRRRRAFKALSTAPKPISGKVLAVQLMTTSNSCSRRGRSDSGMHLPPKESTKACALSGLRLATVMDKGDLAAKCGTHSSIISPAPTKRICTWLRSSNRRPANRTAAAAMLMEWAPISVLLRTSLATENER